jgi:hypothetical protein
MKNLEDLLNNTDFSQESKNKEVIKAMLLNTIKNEEQKKYSKDRVVRKLQFQNIFQLKKAFFRAFARKNAGLVREPTRFLNKSIIRLPNGIPLPR